MKKTVTRIWHLDEISSKKVQKAIDQGQFMKAFISQCVEAGINKGLKDDPYYKPSGVKKLVKMDAALFYNMQSKASKKSLTDSEFVRKSIRQHG